VDELNSRGPDSSVFARSEPDGIDDTPRHLEEAAGHEPEREIVDSDLAQ
jgi:hypothetical protein